MIDGNGARFARVRARVLGTSAMGVAAMLAGPAFAQCAPEPTTANGTTTCRGTDADALRVTTFGTRVVVEQGATVRGANGPAVAVRIASGDGFGAPVTLSVTGLVDGGTDAGVSLVAQPIANNFSSQTLSLTVASGGRVTGANGIVVGRAANSQSFGTGVSVDNSGSIAGTGGIALLSTDTVAGFSSITNRAGGTIGAVAGPVGAISNAGTISGGTRSAIDGVGSASFFGDIGNTGTITATSTAATLTGIANFRTIANSGTIENRGAGAAIAGAGGLIVTNAAAGRIASAGTTAITAGDTLQLTNAGTIAGDVVAGGSATISGSLIDSTAGRITGALRLGSGADTLVGLYDGTQLQYGITGAIDGGAGTDTVRARFATNATLAAPLALPTGFERLSLNPNAGVTATLAAGFVAPGTLLVGGAGTLVNRTALNGAGQVLVGDFQAGGTPTVVNAGTIASTLSTSGTFAVQLSSFTRFENSGTITATRDAVSLSGSGPVVNSGTITAGGTALSTSGSVFTNTAAGVIRSTGGTGLILGGSFGTGQSNAGRIEGATVGVELRSTLVNTGTIASGQTGVYLAGNGTLDNRAGGSVSGSGVAITTQFPGSSFFGFGNTVANAGTITGNVVLGGAQSANNSNRFFALPGGTLNGNLALGQGDLLVAEFVNPGTGAFAGITGTVSATNALLRLRVRQDTTTTLAAPAGFASVGYELFGNPLLTLTGPATTRPLQLAGTGRIDLTVDIATTTAPAIQSTAISVAPGETSTANALTITSRGTLSLVRPNANTFPGAVVALGGNDSFTNAGSIVATDRATTVPSPFSAISGGFSSSSTGGTSVTNSGTITLDATVGISGVRTIVNSGSIVQATGGRAATGIRASSSGGAGQLTNTGTIDVAGVAVQGDSSAFTITNSGRIASSGGAAIVAPNAFGFVIDNLAGGTIAGRAGGSAIQSGGGRLTNAGTITGAVDLGFSTFGQSFTPATYVADGGTIAGSLRFGSGQDTLVAFGALGVSGAIDGGAGIDTLVQARRTSDTVTLGFAGTTNFEALGVRAVGADTVVTTRADAAIAGDLALSGDGTIANGATITGRAYIDNQGSFVGNSFQPGPVLAGFTNTGELRGGFDGETGRFTNSGTIGTATLADIAVSVNATGTLTFANAGTIVNDGSRDAVSLEVYGGGALVATNSGTITGATEAYLSNAVFPVPDAPVPASVSFTNGGTVTAAGARGGTLQLVAELATAAAGTVTLANTGTIEATGRSGIAAGLGVRRFGTAGEDRLVVTNAGTIRANGGGYKDPATDPYAGASIAFPTTYPATALSLAAGAAGRASVTNEAAGTIEATGTQSVALSIASGTLDLANAGTIRGGAGTVLTADDRLGAVTGRPYLAGAIQARGGDDRIVNTGSIIGSVDLAAGADRIDNLGRIEGNVFLGAGNDTFLQRASATLIGTVDGGEGNDLFIVDATGGGAVNGDQFVNFERFSQVGEGNVAYSGTFRFDTVGVMGGTVTVAAGQTLGSNGPVTITGSDAAETVVNDGTIKGSVSLLGGNDRVVNRGTIGGAVLLGDGDDGFVEGTGSRVAGGVDGGMGVDTYTVLLSGDRQGLGARTGFERLGVEGSGTLGLSLDQSFDAVTLAGTGLNATLNGFAIASVAGGDGAERLVVDGDVGSVALGGGDDLVSLGATRGVGRYDGGVGADTLRFTATAPVTLTGSAIGFEQLVLAGNALTVTGTLGSAGNSLGFGDGAQMLTVANGGTLAGAIDLGAGNDIVTLADGGVLTGSLSLGTGDDVLAIGGTRVAGQYDGGAGADTLRFAATGAVTLAGVATGFEQVVLAGGALTVAGTLGSAGASLGFGDGAQALTVAAGGTLAGVVDLGAGNDALRLAAGGTLSGSVAGGAGSDTATIELAGDRGLAAGTLTGFETLATEGRGTLTLAGSQGYDLVAAATDLSVAAGGSLAARQVRFGSGDQRFTIAGGFAGAVDGGAGTDTLAVSGGSEAAPVAFTDVAGIEAFAMPGGYATVSGAAALGSVDMSGGRLVGLVGSTLSAAQFLVRQGATFGSAGTVNGNLPVAGILSPGASPGTMTVNGNVALQSGSLSVFELTPTAQDKLVVNGAVSIASGATLQLVPTGSIRPGTSYDLITATGGITGGFTTVLKPDSLFGFVVQRADRIQLLGQFLADASFAPQVARSVAYANTVLTRQAATSPLFAALPSLLGANGTSNPRAFAQLTPEPYASATQVGVENALALTDAARGPGFAPDRTEPGAFTFGQGVASWYRLAADPREGVSAARTSGYGFLGGVGYGDRGWSAGVFGGWLDSRQRIDALGARTGADGWVAGVHGRSLVGGIGLAASVVYNAADATTRRALPGGMGATGRYDLNSLVADVSVNYAMGMGEWALTPRAGLTYLRTTRERVTETGGAFALTVARDRHVAGFADAGLGFGPSEASIAAFRPFVALGLRYQLEGERTGTVAGYAGGPLGLTAFGASRADTVGTASAGVSYWFEGGLELFSIVSAQNGRDDHREAVSTGLRLRF